MFLTFGQQFEGFTQRTAAILVAVGFEPEPEPEPLEVEDAEEQAEMLRRLLQDRDRDYHDEFGGGAGGKN